MSSTTRDGRLRVGRLGAGDADRLDPALAARLRRAGDGAVLLGLYRHGLLVGFQVDGGRWPGMPSPTTNPGG